MTAEKALTTTTNRPGSLFRQRSFALLWAGQSVSMFGTQITYVALPITAVVILQATPMETGVLTALEQLPFLLFGLFVGVLVDRRARRPILIGANVVRCAALAWIPIAYLLDLLTIGHLFLVAFVVGTMTVFFDLAYQSYVPGLVGRERLMEANGKLQVSESVAEIAGPGIAGVLISAISAPVVIAVDAFSYVLSALALVKMPADAPSAPRAGAGRPAPSVWASVREGFSVIGRHTLLRWCTTAAVVTALFLSALTAVLFLFLIREAGIGTAQVGLIVAAGSAGALLGALSVDRLGDRIGVGPTLVLSLTLPGVGYFILASVEGNSLAAVATAAAANFIALFGIPVFDVTVISFRQVVTPDHLLGRVNATVRTLAWGSLSLGALLGGALGSTLGLRPTILIAAGGLLLPAVILLLSPVRRVRRLGGAEATETEAAAEATTDTSPRRPSHDH
ncbi:MFS transporter [Streptosporangium fragile]|uniref:MFS transporter n=1 Tax=Streptosporangium fragile TaxID=46186 RepID=A0ABN3W6A6_9ACTN